MPASLLPASAFFVLSLVVYAPLAYGQAAPAVTLQGPWDARQIVTSLQGDLDKLRPALNGINPQFWVDKKGAPNAYIVQFQSAQQQLKDVSTVMSRLNAKPESLSLGMDLYFRLEALDIVTHTVLDGARQFDTRALADQLSGVITSSFDHRQKLGSYLRDLAETTEENFRIADSEAQRCRSSVNSQPKPSQKTRR